jgi:hypothetical protein
MAAPETDMDLIWLAGIFQVSGTIGLNVIERGEKTYTYPVFQWEGDVDTCQAIAAVTQCGTAKKRENDERWRWHCGKDDAIVLIRSIEPWLIGKRRIRAGEVLIECNKEKSDD